MDSTMRIQEFTFRDYMRIIFRRQTVLWATTIILIGMAYLGIQLQTPMYEASVMMLISAEKEIQAPYYRDLMSYRNEEIAVTQSEIVKSNPVLERVIRALKLHEKPLDYEKQYSSLLKQFLLQREIDVVRGDMNKLPEEARSAFRYELALERLKSRITVEPVRNTNLFTIRVKDFVPAGAAALANVISRSYVMFDLEQQLAELQIKYGDKHLVIQQLKDNIARLANTLDGRLVENIEALGPASVKIIEQALPPLEPNQLPKPLVLFLAAVMSLFLGLILAFTFDYLDQSFKSQIELETFLGIPYLGSIPARKFGEQLIVKNPRRHNAYNKQYQNLSDQVFLLMKDRKLNSLFLTTADADIEGVTAIATNLALFIAEKIEGSVLLIDANFRNPLVHTLLGIKRNPGLCEVITEKAKVEKAMHIIDVKSLTEITGKNPMVEILDGTLPYEKKPDVLAPHINVITAGSTELNPVTLLSTHRFEELMAKLKKKFALIIFTSSSMRDHRDSEVIAALADGVGVVVDEGKSRKHVVKSTLNRLESGKVSMVGVILNNRTYAIPKLIYDRI